MDAKQKRKVLVTGGGGFLGGAIVERLVKRGDMVFSYSRGSYPHLDKMGVKQIKGDLADPEEVEKAVSGMDMVFHTAAKAGVWGSYEEYFNPNVIGTRNIVSACLKNKTKSLVHTSSPSVIFTGNDMEGVNESVPYPDTFHTHYTKTKAMAEMEVRAACEKGLKAVILRPHLIWGPKDPHIVPRIIERADKLMKVGKKDNLVDTIYIDNAADAHILAGDKLYERRDLSGNVYFISNDEPLPLWDIINSILEAAGLPAITRTISVSAAYSIGAVLEFIYRIFQIKGEPRMTRFVAKELGTSHWYDISAAKKDLGYEAKVSLKEGFSRLKQWLNR